MAEYYLSVFVGLAIIGVLSLDLGLFQRSGHPYSIRRAVLWTLFWIVFALVFNVAVYYWVGKPEALSFLSGYLVEKSLSVDNLFVFLLIFSYFQVPGGYQHKVLFWGIVGAVVLRGLLIGAGIHLIETYHWLTYVFGFFLVFTGVKTFNKSDDELKLEQNPFLRFLRRYLPVTDSYEGNRFFVRKDGKLRATPLVVVLLMIETTDVLFALDSIPAILAITTDPFVLYTSNLFAILGLRALYFVIAGLMRKFQYLNYGICLVLIFVGAKMIVEPWLDVSEGITLGAIVLLIGGSVMSSVFAKSDEPLPVSEDHHSTTEK